MDDKRNAPSGEYIVYASQIVIIYFVIVVSIINLSLNVSNTQLWLTMFTSMVAYLLPSPNMKKGGLKISAPDEVDSAGTAGPDIIKECETEVEGDPVTARNAEQIERITEQDGEKLHNRCNSCYNITQQDEDVEHDNARGEVFLSSTM